MLSKTSPLAQDTEKTHPKETRLRVEERLKCFDDFPPFPDNQPFLAGNPRQILLSYDSFLRALFNSIPIQDSHVTLFVDPDIQQQIQLF
jgi:hypothetical protein